MQGVARILWLGCAAAFLAAGCATSLDVRVDEEHDFSGDRSWDWSARWTRLIEATPGDELRLDALTTQLVADALAGSGRTRATAGDADLLVAFELKVTREQVAVNETGAIYQLSSHHSSPSFLVQATEKRIETYHRGSLRVDLRDRRTGRLVWQGELQTRNRGDLDDTLRDSIPRLLARLAPAGAAPSVPVGLAAEAQGR